MTVFLCDLRTNDLLYFAPSQKLKSSCSILLFGTLLLFLQVRLFLFWRGFCASNAAGAAVSANKSFALVLPFSETEIVFFNPAVWNIAATEADVSFLVQLLILLLDDNGSSVAAFDKMSFAFAIPFPVTKIVFFDPAVWNIAAVDTDAVTTAATAGEEA
mmetsp:Transcript_33841/g.81407  ORF Transcript_33841/g.81407 Transcript_33841/m.81407 type:complete len:159 (-) Transcript_33841:577-1053(-)